MAKRRTKKEKVATVQKREQLTYSLPVSKTTSVESTLNLSVSKQSMPNLFAYDVTLLKKDLQKTLINSTIIVILLAGLYFWRG